MKKKLFYILFFILSPLFLVAQTDTLPIGEQLKNIQLDSRAEVVRYIATLNRNSTKIPPREGIDLCKHFLQEMAIPPRNKAIIKDSASYMIERFTERFHNILEENEQAKQASKRALIHAKRSSNRFVIETYQAICVANMRDDNFAEAIDYLLKAIEEIDTSVTPSRYNAASYGYLSACYSFVGEMKESIKYLKIAETSYLTLEPIIGTYRLNGVYSGLLQNYIKLKERDSVNFYLEKFIQSTDQLEDDIKNHPNPAEHSTSLVASQVIAANYFLEEKQMENAKKYYDKVNNSTLARPHEKYLLDIRYALATNNLKKVSRLIKNRPPNMDQINYNPHEYYTFEQLCADYYERIGDFKNSLIYTNKCKENELEKLKKQQISFSKYIDYKFNTLEQQKNIETLEDKQQYQAKQNFFLVGLLTVILMFFGLLYYAFQQLKKKNSLLNQNLENKKTIEIQSQKIQQAQNQKNRLFTNIAHEFQTPLSIIKGLGKSIYNKEQLSEEGQQGLNIIIKNSHQLSKMTNELLATNMGANTFNEELATFSLSDLFQYLAPEYDFLAKEKNIKLSLPNLSKEEVITSNVFKIETILRNLLSNAIKHTPENGIIDVKYRTIEKDRHQLQISDNGQGISTDDLPFLFDRYYQSSNQSAKGGFGLGLAICKEFIESLNGTIQVESRVGEGTIFTIIFPNISNQEEIATELYEFPMIALPISKTNLEKEQVTTGSIKKLLIVEDNKDFCQYLATILGEEYQLKFTHNGQEALKYLDRHLPDLIITDWMMPLMDGQELVTELKSTEKYVGVPVLMLTARTLISDKFKMLRIGIDEYLLKTIDETTLKEAIQRMLAPYTAAEQEEPMDSKIALTLENRDWLIALEQQLLPNIGDFNLDIDTIAAAQNLHPKQLSRKIKALTGFTAKKYIQEIRFWEARRLLETRAYGSVKAVSLSVGYKDYKYFSQKFKERFGDNPSVFLKQS